jgi:hypothetical protein
VAKAASKPTGVIQVKRKRANGVVLPAAAIAYGILTRVLISYHGGDSALAKSLGSPEATDLLT